MFFIVFYLDKLAHWLGYSPSREKRFWWCEYAEDKLTEIAFRHDNDGCYWCRRYYE